MSRLLAALLWAFAFLAVGALVSTGAAPSPASANALPLAPGMIGMSPTQVGLTASYSVIGGGGSQAQDILTYVSNGAQQTALLTATPTTYMVDSGTLWNAQAMLNGSTSTERWMTTQDVAGSIAAPLTVAFSYYHQYRMTFNFNVTNGGVGFSGPPVTFNQLGGPVTSAAPEVVWVDASSPYSYASTLPGSTSTERWISPTPAAGAVTSSGSVTVTFYHEYLVSSSYSIVGGGSPTPPILASAALGSPASTPMTVSTQASWLDAGAATSFSASLTGTSTERWMGTVLVKTQSGNVLSMNNNGTVTGPISITPVYYHQLLVNVTFTFVGGSTNGLTLPAFAYLSFGSQGAAGANSAVWVDAGTQYALPEAICCTTSPGTERWELNNSTTGTITSATRLSSTYFHQYFESFSYSVVGGPPTLSPPNLTYIAAGNAQTLTLDLTPQSAWADAGSSYSATSTLSASTASERWFSPAATGSIVGPAPDLSVNVDYYQQYLLTIVGGGLPTQWVNAGSDTTLVTPGVFGRSQGTGLRAISYQVDSGSVTAITQPAALVSIQLSMDGPHTITFQSVRQFQVSLDAGAAGALSSITPPTVPGDSYWYDTDSQVQLVLHGAYGRANGVGQRLSTISATAQPTKQVNTVGDVQAYTTTALETPVSITTTSITQYAVVLNKAALDALASITPSSTFPNDTFWYDSGSPSVTVVLNAVYSRSAGTGLRISSWEMDSGPSTKIASTGTITVATKALTSPHFLNATSVTQYQVTIDKGGTSALVSITNPPIPLDAGWYDASSPLGVVMNGVWGRASGTGQRLAGYSVNGGPQTAVASSGLVVVLNATKLSSPEAITASIATQYQVALDSGATSALSSITSTPIPQDKYWFDSGTPVDVSLNGVWARSAATGTRLASYSVNQGASTAVISSSPTQVLSLSGISGPQSIATKTVAQYHLASSPVAWASGTDSTLPGDSAGWFDSGTTVKVVYNAIWNQTSMGSRASVVSYSIDGGARTNVARSGTGSFTVTVTMTAGHSISLTSVTQYLLAVVGPSHATAAPPSQTGDSYFDAGSKVAFTVPRVWNGSSKPDVREMLTSYSVDGASPVPVASSTSSASFTTAAVTFNLPHTLIFNALAQYQVAFQFLDGLGRNPVQPSLVQIAVGNATIDVHGQSVWLANGTSFRVVSVTWEGASVGPTPPPSYQVVAARLNVTLDTRVYDASLKVVDLFGLPVSGAQVSMTLANGTAVTGTTKGDGTFAVPMIPLGAFTAKVSTLGTSAQIVGDASSAQQVAEGRVALSLISLVAMAVVVAGAGAAGLFLFRRKRRAKK